MTLRQNSLVLFMSGHRSFFAEPHSINRLYIAEFGNTTQNYAAHYAPSFIPLGAMLLAMTYLFSRTLNTSKTHNTNLLIVLLLLATAQLCIEIARGYYAYPYHFHLPRLGLISVCALLFGQCLLLYVMRSTAKCVNRNALVLSAFTTLCAMFLVSDYDYRAIVAIQIPCAVGLVLLIQPKFKHRPMPLPWQNKMGCIVLGTLLATTLIGYGEFLDVYFYYVIAAVLVLLTKLEADNMTQLSSSVHEYKLQASRREEQVKPLQVTSSGQIALISPADILFCKSAGDYIELICRDKTELFSGSFQQLQKCLPTGFLRVHRSYMVNAKWIKGLTRKPSGNGELVLDNGDCVPVSRSHFAQTKSAIQLL